MRPASRAVVGLLVVSLTLALAGCGDDDTTSAAPDTTAVNSTSASADSAPDGAIDHRNEVDVTIVVTDNVFTDQHIVISAGTTVTWRNDGRNDHNVTPDTDGVFAPIATAALGPGASGSITFDEPGVYPYHCSLHGVPGRAQFGTIIVDPA
jgi:plastocyanin